MVNGQDTYMVPNEEIVTDKLKFIFSHPPLNYGGLYLICYSTFNIVTPQNTNRTGPTLHKVICNALEETVGGGKMCSLLEILQEPTKLKLKKKEG